MIILTGGAGFIGSAFLWKLNTEGVEDIIIVDDLGETEKWKNLADKKFVDYVQKDDFLRMVEDGRAPKAEAVVHMGACSSTTLTDADYYMRNNYEYSKALAKWALAGGASFLYASSAATYGSGDTGYDDNIENISDLRPLNMYGFSKHLFDLWILDNGLIDKVTGLKFFNVFGPNEYHKGDMRSVVCKAFKDARDEGVIKLFRSYREDYADGEQKRDFIYIKDAVEVMYYFLANPASTGIYNLGTGKARSWNDLAKALFAALGKRPRIEYVDMPENLKDKYQYFTEARMTRLRGVMKDKLKFRELEDSVADYVKYLEKDAYL